MPAPSDQELADFIRERGPFRVGCTNCDCDTLDGVKAIPPDWQDVGEVQSLRAALTTYDGEGDPEPPDNYSVLDWWTHLGLCPDCAREESEISRQMRS